MIAPVAVALMIISQSVQAIERLALPPIIGYSKGDPVALYQRQMHLAPVETLEAIAAMAERGSAEVREEALLILARIEAVGEVYDPNLPKALAHIREAGRYYVDMDRRVMWAGEVFTQWEAEARSLAERRAAQYLRVAYQREMGRDAKRVTLASISREAWHSIPMFKEKQNPDAFSRAAIESGNAQGTSEELRALAGIWKLADEDYPQAQYEIGLYLFRMADRSTNPAMMRDKGVVRLWRAASQGHRPSAETLVDYWLNHRTIEHIEQACSLVLAFRQIADETRRRRLLFSRSAADCGRPGKPGRHNEQATSDLVRVLRQTGLYLAEGNVHGPGALIWDL